MSASTAPTCWHSAQSALGREVVEALGSLSQRRSYPPRTRLWSAGDPADALVALERGQVRIFRELPSGSSVSIFVFGPGDVFGFMPFLDGGVYPASAETLVEVDAIVTPRSALLEAFERSPRLAHALVALLARRLRDAFDRIEDAAGTAKLPRAATALLSLAATGGPPGDQVITLPMKSAELAAALGMAPETLSRAVTALVEERVLHRLGSRKYQVLDLDRLRQIAAGRRAAG